MKKSPLAFALFAALATAGTGNAHGDHDHDHDHDEFRQHGAHVHGVGQLDVVIDGDHLLMDLVMPGADVVGFEHAAATPEEEQANAVALEQLQAADQLFLLPAAADCRLDIAEARVARMEDDHHDHGHHDDDHEHGHGHDDHHDNEGHHHDDHAHDDDHSEFHVEYVFHCDAPERLDHIEVRVFAVFPDNETLQARVAGPGGQTATELNAGNTRLTLNP